MSKKIAGRPTRKELADLVESGEIDTIIVAITDMQGRLQGKRLDATYFFTELADGVVEGCSYLLASDVDMRTVDGFALTSWERGYGDLAFKPDFNSTRLVPWHEKTVIIFADVRNRGGRARRSLAPSYPGAPSRATRRARVDRHYRHGTRIHCLRRHVRTGVGRRVSRHDSGQPVQR